MNTVFEYMYRDGSNYKNWGSVVFAGEVTPELRARCIRALFDGEFFIAHQIAIPEIFFKGSLYDDDHCLHEFVALEATEAAPNDSHGRDIAAFVQAIETAKTEGWAVFERTDRLIVRTNHRRARSS